MIKTIVIYMSFISLIGCTSTQFNNHVLNEKSDASHIGKSVLFKRGGDVSLVTYNVSILKNDYGITNNDTANVFSFTDCDTSKKRNDKSIVDMVWIGGTVLEISYPSKGTVWKSDSLICIAGVNYNIKYKTK